MPTLSASRSAGVMCVCCDADLKKRPSRVLLSFVLAWFSAAAIAQVQPKSYISYELVELPLRPLSISNSGWVSGTASGQKAARWSAQAGLELVPLPPDFTFAAGNAINAEGDMVGTASTGDSSRRVGFLFRKSIVSLLQGEQSSAEDISDLGEIVGQARLAGKPTVSPVLWRNGIPFDLGICCAGTARRINQAGVIFGESYDPNGHYHAFSWNIEHGAKRLNPSEEEYSSVLALNNRGQAIIRVVPEGLWLYSGGHFIQINAPHASPRSLNDRAEMVGSFGVKLEGQRAFIWSSTEGLRDLNDLVPPNSGWTLEVATGINDRGEIVGWGDHGKIENAGFLLRPAREKRSH